MPKLQLSIATHRQNETDGVSRSIINISSVLSIGKFINQSSNYPFGKTQTCACFSSRAWTLQELIAATFGQNKVVGIVKHVKQAAEQEE